MPSTSPSEAATACVIGAGFGFWWLDPLAAGIISLDILKDGASSLRNAVTDHHRRKAAGRRAGAIAKHAT